MSEIEKSTKESLHKAKIILFVVHSVNARKFYKTCKNHFNSVGIPTQFWSSYRSKSHNLSVFCKVLLQMYAKIGHKIWKIRNPLSPMFRGSTIVLAINARRSDGFVTFSAQGTLNNDFTEFYSPYLRFSNQKY